MDTAAAAGTMIITSDNNATSVPPPFISLYDRRLPLITTLDPETISLLFIKTISELAKPFIHDDDNTYNIKANQLIEVIRNDNDLTAPNTAKEVAEESLIPQEVAKESLIPRDDQSYGDHQLKQELNNAAASSSAAADQLQKISLEDPTQQEEFIYPATAATTDQQQKPPLEEILPQQKQEFIRESAAAAADQQLPEELLQPQHQQQERHESIDIPPLRDADQEQSFDKQQESRSEDAVNKLLHKIEHEGESKDGNNERISSYRELRFIDSDFAEIVRSNTKIRNDMTNITFLYRSKVCHIMLAQQLLRTKKQYRQLSGDNTTAAATTQDRHHNMLSLNKDYCKVTRLLNNSFLTLFELKVRKILLYNLVKKTDETLNDIMRNHMSYVMMTINKQEEISHNNNAISILKEINALDQEVHAQLMPCVPNSLSYYLYVEITQQQHIGYDSNGIFDTTAAVSVQNQSKRELDNYAAARFFHNSDNIFRTLPFYGIRNYKDYMFTHESMSLVFFIKQRMSGQCKDIYQKKINSMIKQFISPSFMYLDFTTSMSSSNNNNNEYCGFFDMLPYFSHCYLNHDDDDNNEPQRQHNGQKTATSANAAAADIKRRGLSPGIYNLYENRGLLVGDESVRSEITSSGNFWVLFLYCVLCLKQAGLRIYPSSTSNVMKSFCVLKMPHGKYIRKLILRVSGMKVIVLKNVSLVPVFCGTDIVDVSVDNHNDNNNDECIRNVVETFKRNDNDINQKEKYNYDVADAIYNKFFAKKNQKDRIHKSELDLSRMSNNTFNSIFMNIDENPYAHTTAAAANEENPYAHTTSAAATEENPYVYTVTEKDLVQTRKPTLNMLVNRQPMDDILRYDNTLDAMLMLPNVFQTPDCFYEKTAVLFELPYMYGRKIDFNKTFTNVNNDGSGGIIATLKKAKAIYNDL